ncbi:hypothetical protein ZWY2020_055118 [Hordeum vulgare]|nr:hypothetical protein ZWY2020_055118 [Hordeum vulgare]
MYGSCDPVDYLQSFKEDAETFLSSAETTVCWDDYPCRQCERNGRRCAFSSERNEQFCMPGGSRIKVIAATSSVAAFVVLLLTVATVLYLSLKTRYNAEIHLKVEMFLKTYGTSKPTRRNSDPSTESRNDVYLPEWIYEKVINGEELALTLEATQEEKEKVRQLAMVALWCIQWNPRNRPSMTKVVNMLTGRLQSLQMPPKPFVSYENEPVL